MRKRKKGLKKKNARNIRQVKKGSAGDANQLKRKWWGGGGDKNVYHLKKMGGQEEIKERDGLIQR